MASIVTSDCSSLELKVTDASYEGRDRIQVVVTANAAIFLGHKESVTLANDLLHAAMTDSELQAWLEAAIAKHHEPRVAYAERMEVQV